jgi:hypothetical protein
MSTIRTTSRIRGSRLVAVESGQGAGEASARGSVVVVIARSAVISAAQAAAALLEALRHLREVEVHRASAAPCRR